MKKIVSEPLIFFAASGSIVTLLLFHPSYSILQISSICILLGITVLFSLLSKAKKTLFSGTNYYLLLFFTTLFIELLVVSTGGTASHFFLIALLFSLALSFFIDIAAAVTFLICFFIVLITQLLLDKHLLALINEDPTSTLLFCLTMLITVVLTYYINHFYHFKDTLLELLKKQILLQDIHEKSILRHIQEMIIITDKNLRIISVNEAVEKSLLLPKADLLQKELFEVVLLHQENNEPITRDTFPLQKIINEKYTLTLQHLTLTSKNASKTASLALIAKPILDLEGKVDQLIFIIQQEANLSHQSEHLLLDQVITKHKAMIEDVRRALIEKGFRDLAFKTEVIGKIDREIRHLIRLENDTVDSDSTSVNLAKVGQSLCIAMRDFAQALHISLAFYIQEENDKRQVDVTHNDTLEKEFGNTYLANVNLKWFDVLLHKLMEITILLSSSTNDPKTYVVLQKENGKLSLSIAGNYTGLTENDIPSLYLLNYNDLSSKTNLHLASGLEGMIAERISKKIKVPIRTEITENGFSFTVSLPTLNPNTQAVIPLDSETSTMHD